MSKHDHEDSEMKGAAYRRNWRRTASAKNRDNSILISIPEPGVSTPTSKIFHRSRPKIIRKLKLRNKKKKLGFTSRRRLNPSLVRWEWIRLPSAGWGWRCDGAKDDENQNWEEGRREATPPLPNDDTLLSRLSILHIHPYISKDSSMPRSSQEKSARTLI